MDPAAAGVRNVWGSLVAPLVEASSTQTATRAAAVQPALAITTALVQPAS